MALHRVRYRRRRRYPASSIALVGFGIDSLIESLGGFIIVWRFGIRRRAAFGWWWADPAAALVIAAVAAKEGREAWRGDACECC